MAKLYPPIIEGKLPAQSGTELKIPFRLNRSVSINQVDCVIARIKTVSTNHWKGTIPEITSELKASLSSGAFSNIGPQDKGDYVTAIKLEGTGVSLEPGQYYKVQLAFYDNANEQVGYYSSIGVFKYTTIPTVDIYGFEESSAQDQNANRYEYIGGYENIHDITEKVYSYIFNVFRMSDNTVVATSGELIHDNSSDDEIGKSRDYFELETSLQHGETYQIEYKVTTVNGLVASSPKYTIVASDHLPNTMQGTFHATNDYDSGRINLRFKPFGKQWQVKDNYGFVVSRSSSESNFTVWRDIFKFSVDARGAFPEDLGSDYTVEQGETYQYALQFYQPSGLRSARLTTDRITADFEDIFLYDGARQLRVRFNPSISSFKITTLENKVDTIGGPYPFFFRNGNIAYKEFPLSGLISYLMDENEEFMSNAELGFIDAQPRISTPGLEPYQPQRGTNLSTENFKAERLFKTQALVWLNNGKAKLFRSPAEGNFIIRLMNVSLSPNDQIGRMTHTFSSTAYEIAECTYKNMVKYNFVDEKRFDNKILLYLTNDIRAHKKANKNKWSQNFVSEGGVYKAELREVKPGTIFSVKFADQPTEQQIMIGSTGTYTFNIYESPIQYISLAVDNYDTGGYFDYGYYTTGEVSDFSEVHNIYYSMQPFNFAHQYGYSTSPDMAEKISLIDYYENTKQKVAYIYVLKLEQRRIKTVYEKSGKYYTNDKYTNEVVMLPDTIYKVANTSKYIDGYSGSSVLTTVPDYMAYIKFDDDRESLIDISGPGEIIYHSLNNIKDIRIGNGIYATGMYQQAEYVYGIEVDPNSSVYPYHVAYMEAKNKYRNNEITYAAYKTALDNLNHALNRAGIKEV